MDRTFIREVYVLVDDFLDKIETVRANVGLTEKQAVMALESAAAYSDIAEMYTTWLDDSEPEDRDGSMDT